MKNPVNDFKKSFDCHEGMIKSILIADDSVAITGGVDKTVKVWDIGTRKVI
eukprot:CAMPEP_0116884936 /NCGR_PEP_ID=MMETSP0463-20121206/18047_1 /TAXON_ID=181622 /ORGANISM="Strombidinopsis sp, Strain SopsisLIS2011" /LENGTH=50 /DNA_ID=CAMNT_0004542377 /DNA_START=659 /DNA_END=811 /DNA_ORIENTATION=+